MSKYAGLFASAPPARNMGGLFGEAKKPDPVNEIMVWCAKKSVKTTANRISFILNGVRIEDLTAIHISDIGEFNLNEATEACRCVDQVVSDYAAMKPLLENGRMSLLSAISRIEEATKPPPLFGLLGAKKVDWNHVRGWVKGDIDKACADKENLVKYHLDPFIDGLKIATNSLETIGKNIGGCIDAMDFVIESSQNATIQDLARRRKEMFAKSAALMAMNKDQLDTMHLAAQKAKDFVTELQTTIKPLLENIVRSAIVSDADPGEAMKEIHAKLKGMM